MLIVSSRSNNTLFLISEDYEDLYENQDYNEEYESENASTIHTEGCRIPFMNTVEESVREFIPQNYPDDIMEPCKGNPLVESNKTYIWIQKENIKYYKIEDPNNLKCCYKSFYRPTQIDDITATNNDERVKYNKCVYFNDTIEVAHEFVRVICGDNETVFDTFLIFAREKEAGNDVKAQKDLPYNVLILGIDSVSRLNFHRTMPKTAAFIKYLDAVELYGYNKIGDNTFPNLIAVLLGKKDTELEDTCLPNTRAFFDNCPFIWERFQRAGYSTALAEDNASMGMFDFVKRGFVGFPTDYYFHTFIHQAEHHAGTNKDNHAFLCMNEKFFFKILLDYVEDLATTLKNKLFGFFWEITMSHGRLNYPMVMDDSYTNFFTKMQVSGYLNQTIIFFMSDHGMRWGAFRQTRQGYLEDRLPFVFALFPPSFREKYNLAYTNLKLNSRRLTTPFDIHSTLLDLTALDNIEDEKIKSRSNENYSQYRNISLFLPVPSNRTCRLADIDDHWCACHNRVPASRKSLEAKEAAEFVVSHLNGLLKDYPQCVELKLSEVMSVTELLLSGSEDSKWRELSVVVRTWPGGGVFEATVGRGVGRWSLAGAVSRLNFYDDQSHCVPHYQLKLYCYCS
ncbi:uncharacterized protein LOC134655154 [Cydia amplana]|uniref:uncharacterized protein LOC134655154 n=1 Tax=Cydia amplana TaxID=1869771 RepID=UPI002FE66E40